MTLTRDYLEGLYSAFAGNGANASPAWVKERRAEGMEAFAKVGFPTPRQEEWRFTSVKPILNQPFELPDPSVTATEEDVARFVSNPDALLLVFVDGTYRAELSRVDELPEGVLVGSLKAAAQEHAEIVGAHLGRYVPTDANGFTALNAAFHADGAFVYVPAGTDLEREIHILYLSRGSGRPVMSHPRTLAIVEQGGRARVVELYGGLGKEIYLTNAVTEAVVGDGARLDWYRVQQEAEAAFHVANTYSSQGRDSHYSLITVPFGAALCRHDVRMVMDGEGGEGTLNGLYVIRGSQHVDHQTVIEHARPHCNSHEYFNGILDEKAHAVFNGRIIVQPGAQKTDSKQTNNNLLLSETARADSQPQLEIYADDVRCTHGATLGPMDDNALFYLQSRGIDREAARGLLTYGFSSEILDGIESEPLRAYLDRAVKARLDQVAAVTPV